MIAGRTTGTVGAALRRLTPTHLFRRVGSLNQHKRFRHAASRHPHPNDLWPKKFSTPPTTPEGILPFLSSYIKYNNQIKAAHKRSLEDVFPSFSWDILSQILEKQPSKSLEAGKILAQLLPQLSHVQTSPGLSRTITRCLKYALMLQKWPIILDIVAASEVGEATKSMKWLQIYKAGALLLAPNNQERQPSAEAAVRLLDEILPPLVESNPQMASYYMNDVLGLLRTEHHQKVLYEVMLKHRVSLSQPTFLARLQGASSLATALDIENDMKQELRFDRSTQVDLAIVERLFRLAVKESNKQEADRIYKDYKYRVLHQADVSTNEASRALGRLYQSAYPVSLVGKLHASYQYQKYDEFITLFTEWRRNPSESSSRERTVLLNMALIVFSKQNKPDVALEIYREILASNPTALNPTSLAIVTDFLGFNNMLDEFVNLWKQTLGAGVWPPPNCWTSFIEALSRHKEYSLAFDTVGAYLKECEHLIKSPLPPEDTESNRILPDVKLAGVFLNLIAFPSLGEKDYNSIMRFAPLGLRSVLRRKHQTPQEAQRKLTPHEFDEFSAIFAKMKQRYYWMHHAGLRGEKLVDRILAASKASRSRGPTIHEKRMETDAEEPRINKSSKVPHRKGPG